MKAPPGRKVILGETQAAIIAVMNRHTENPAINSRQAPTIYGSMIVGFLVLKTDLRRNFSASRARKPLFDFLATILLAVSPSVSVSVVFRDASPLGITRPPKENGFPGLKALRVEFINP